MFENIGTIAEGFSKLSDHQLMGVLPFVRNENGEKMTLAELKDCIRESVERTRKNGKA
jgi:hypothetical protein